MKVLRLDHVGIAVRDKDKAEGFLLGVLGARKIIDESWEYLGQVFNWAYYLMGESGMVELISSPDPENFINRFIEKRGEGLHHLTLKVENFEEAVADLRAQGIEVVDINDQGPHWKEGYIRPRDACGVLIQIAEFDDSYWAEMAESGD